MDELIKDIANGAPFDTVQAIRAIAQKLSGVSGTPKTAPTATTEAAPQEISAPRKKKGEATAEVE